MGYRDLYIDVLSFNAFEQVAETCPSRHPSLAIMKLDLKTDIPDPLALHQSTVVLQTLSLILS